jgi:hypothetical protein
VEDGIERGAARCFEILSYGGMGHTAGVHTRSREAAVRYGSEMPASRVTVNTPTTHGAIGFSTALPPSMTLGCGSWGGNVTSDNVSPLHLMDIKRVAFETRPVKSMRPAVATQKVASGPSPRVPVAAAPLSQTAAGKVSRQEIADIVDRFLANRQPEQASGPAPELHATTSRQPVQPGIDIEAGSMYASPKAAPHAEAAPTAVAEPRGNDAGSSDRVSAKAGTKASANGRAAVDFVSEDDVRSAIQKGEKIYINARTIITPAARDMADPAEVFAKV